MVKKHIITTVIWIRIISIFLVIGKFIDSGFLLKGWMDANFKFDESWNPWLPVIGIVTAIAYLTFIKLKLGSFRENPILAMTGILWLALEITLFWGIWISGEYLSQLIFVHVLTPPLEFPSVSKVDVWHGLSRFLADVI